MTAMDCTALAAVAPELALEILDGDERAAAIEHLDGCVTCQLLVDTLAADADRLLMLAPTAEPPAGFQERVLTSLTQVARPATPRPRPRARAIAVLAMAASVAFLALALSLGPSGRPTPVAAEMRTAGGDVVGQVFVHSEPQPALFMTLPGWGEQIGRYAVPAETYSLRIERGNRPPRVVPFDVENDSSWGTTLNIDPDTITSVAVVDSQGHVWCQAEL